MFSPRPHDLEASGSGLALHTDPAVLTLLKRLTLAQEHQEAAQQRQAQESAVAFTEIRSRQDAFSSSNLRSSVSRPSFRDSSSRLSNST
jgi:hypothetical protein